MKYEIWNSMLDETFCMNGTEDKASNLLFPFTDCNFQKIANVKFYKNLRIL